MITDREIMCALIGRVSTAADGDVETSVRTVITRPMWNAFLRATGTPENTEPTQWIGIKKTHRVYGSETIVVESDKLSAFSFKP